MWGNGHHDRVGQRQLRLELVCAEHGIDGAAGGGLGSGVDGHDSRSPRLQVTSGLVSHAAGADEQHGRIGEVQDRRKPARYSRLRWLMA